MTEQDSFPLPIEAQRLGYRLHARVRDGSDVWRAERDGRVFAMRRVHASDQAGHSYLRLRHRHYPGLRDIIDEGEMLWLVLDWCPEPPLSSIRGVVAERALLATATVWCALRDAGYVGFPERLRIGLGEGGIPVVLSLGGLQPAGTAGVAESGWLALVSAAEQLLWATGRDGLAARLLDRVSGSEPAEQLAARVEGALRGSADPDDRPDPGRESTAQTQERTVALAAEAASGGRGLLPSARAVLGLIDDVLLTAESRLSERRRRRAGSKAARRGRSRGPALVAVSVAALLVVAAVLLL